MSRPPRLGLGSRLTLVVAAGFLALQLLGLAALAAWNAHETGRWRYPFPDRLAAMARSVEAAGPAGREDLLRALSSNDTTVRIGSPGAEAGWTRRPGASLAIPYGPALEGRRVDLLVRKGRKIRPPPGPGMAGRDVALAVALRDGAVLIVEPGRALRRQAVFYGLLVVNVLAGLVVLLLVWLSARAIAAPLQAIADRADRFALDLDTAPMQERGPREARAVAAAFNRLRGELRRLMAERLRMLAAIAHDLKTYLTRLRLRAALIADEAQRDAADRDVRLMSELIEDVLLVARGEERLPASGPVDLARLAAETVAARAGAGEAVTLEGSVGGGALVTGDETGLRRALENLIGNAVKYAGAGRVVLTAEGDGWSLAVVDQGPGLPDGFEAEAFDLFSRAEGSRSRETGGAGLGLSIARALVRQSGGDVSLTPTPGGGLTATIHLPA